MSIEKYELRSLRYKVEQEQRWQDEVARLPWIQFPSDWKVKMIPPYGDAVVRFLVTLPDGKEKSVYHDSRASLGMYFGRGDEPIPYWEVYPVNGDIGRCGTDEVELLLEMIAEGSEEKKETKMDEWIIDRRPTEEDAIQKTVFAWIDGKCTLAFWDYVSSANLPWQPISKPEPYVKPKRFVVKRMMDIYSDIESCGCCVYNNIGGVFAKDIPTREAAERIAAIYEEVMP